MAIHFSANRDNNVRVVWSISEEDLSDSGGGLYVHLNPSFDPLLLATDTPLNGNPEADVVIGGLARNREDAIVLDTLGESIPCADYDAWMVHIGEGKFLSRIGPAELLKLGGLNYKLELSRRNLNLEGIQQSGLLEIDVVGPGDLDALLATGARCAPRLKSFAEGGPQGALDATKLL
ncbi:hypothetical protein Ancab_002753 [Ancistrocladus abbreviatus]